MPAPPRRRREQLCDVLSRRKQTEGFLSEGASPATTVQALGLWHGSTVMAVWTPVLLKDSGRLQHPCSQSWCKATAGLHRRVFHCYDGTSRGEIARLNADGSLDSSFLATGTGVTMSGGFVNSIAVQNDAKFSWAGSSIHTAAPVARILNGSTLTVA